MRSRMEYDTLLMPFVVKLGYQTMQGILQSKYGKDKVAQLEVAQLEDLLQYLETHFGGLTGGNAE